MLHRCQRDRAAVAKLDKLWWRLVMRASSNGGPKVSSTLWSKNADFRQLSYRDVGRPLTC
ncbi:MAG: hypothetical protein AAB289_10985 [Chloroflexota bacterium]